MRISDWSSDVCSSDLALPVRNGHQRSQPGENGPRRSVRDHPAAPEGEAPRLRCRALLQVLKPPPMSAPHKTETAAPVPAGMKELTFIDRKSTRLNSSH